MKLYTKTGDEGKTSVLGARVGKDHLRVEAIGTVDELNCFIGQSISVMTHSYGELKQSLQLIQHDLFDLGVDLASLAPKEHKITPEKVVYLEQNIDHLSEHTPEITFFILPGGSQSAACLHVCRAVCRRAERAVVRLAKQHAVHPEAKKYINRLSDYLFAAARFVNHYDKIVDIRYESK